MQDSFVNVYSERDLPKYSILELEYFMKKIIMFVNYLCYLVSIFIITKNAIYLI